MKFSKVIVFSCAVFMIFLGVYSYLVISDLLQAFVWTFLGIFFVFLGYIKVK